MKAAVMTQFREPVEIRSVSDPLPGPDDALIEVNEIPVESVNEVLSSMTDFGTVGFQVINSW